MSDDPTAEVLAAREELRAWAEEHKDVLHALRPTLDEMGDLFRRVSLSPDPALPLVEGATFDLRTRAILAQAQAVRDERAKGVTAEKIGHGLGLFFKLFAAFAKAAL